jgi:hypothetical protein
VTKHRSPKTRKEVKKAVRPDERPLKEPVRSLLIVLSESSPIDATFPRIDDPPPDAADL